MIILQTKQNVSVFCCLFFYFILRISIVKPPSRKYPNNKRANANMLSKKLIESVFLSWMYILLQLICKKYEWYRIYRSPVLIWSMFIMLYITYEIVLLLFFVSTSAKTVLEIHNFLNPKLKFSSKLNNL